MILKEIKNIFIKNRLTEGVDFVRKEWLRSTGGAQIGLNYTNNGNYEIELKGKELKAIGTDASQILGGTFNWSSGLFIIAIRKSTGNLMFANNSAVYPSAFQEFTLKVTPSENADNLDVDINNTIYQITKKKLSLMRLFYWYSGSKVTQHTEGCVGHLKVDNYCNMYPCQLLKSIPATLDANNIARSAGECGMYDSVSGKFYGNVNNTGTFTVEGEVEPETHTGLQQIYQNRLIEGVDYETYEWLKYMNWSKPEGQNALLGAYLICNLKVTTILNFTLKLGETIRAINNEDIELIVRSSTRTYYIRRSYYSNNIAIYSSTSRISNFYNLGTELDFLITDEGLFVNDVHLINEKIEYINQFSSYGRSCTGSISRVTTEEGADVLVPCTLLHSIPRNLDAQCKERVAGDCGMIDLISGKFYGNVANSGTFIIENDNNE